jgi:hypothetical protein
MLTSPSPREPDGRLETLRSIVRWLDDRYLDPLLGLLLPGAGDLVSSVVGLAIVREASRRGLPLATQSRMVLNLALDALVGSVPLLGDVFDFVWKANAKNLALLETRHAGRPASAGDYVVFAAALALLAGTLALPIFLVSWLLGARD